MRGHFVRNVRHRKLPRRWGIRVLGLLVGCLGGGAIGHGHAAEPTPAEVFERRILPIFRSPNPSACTQCHLAGVDLKNYLLPDATKSFRSLRDQGLIDLEAPEKSPIVRLIERGGTDAVGPNAVHARVRKVEREAFVAWLTACAADPQLRASPALAESERAGPSRPVEVIRHARADRIVESFEKNVWAWRFRCMNCHAEGTPQNDKARKEHGDRVAWMKKAGAAETVDYLLASDLLDLARPERSVLLRKPLGEKHAGGTKFVVGDDAYKGFRIWIEDVAAIRGDKYAKAADLPPADEAPARFGTDLWLKLEKCPPAWGDKLLLVRIYAWDERLRAWEDRPLATTDRTVFGKGRLWQHNLTLLAAEGTPRATEWRAGKPTLPPGKYRADCFVDAAGKLRTDWQAELGAADFVGRLEFQARWKEGYGAMTVVDASAPRQ